MQIIKTKFKKLFFIKNETYKDNRGGFARLYCQKKIKKINFKVKQVNISINKKKFTLRGFHYQKKPYEEDKIISCVSGKIYNVAIDLRKKSKTYLMCHQVFLDSKKNISLHVPKGFANAYLTIENNTKIIYFMSQFYNPKHSMGFSYNDNFFSIKWPHKPLIISKKDRALKFFNA